MGYVVVRGVREHRALSRTARGAPGCEKFKGLNSITTRGYLPRQCPLAGMLLFEWTTTKCTAVLFDREARNHIPPQTGISRAVFARLANPGC